MPQYFLSLGPALMISMGYINLGKWVTIVEGGARFGFDLGLLLVIFNATAIMCQYLAACIGTVSGKNLAEICSEEYCKPVCILLGVQAELSMITTELTTVLGMAYGLGLLFGVDLLTCVLFITVGAVLLRLLMTLLGNYKTELLCIGMAGFGLLFYVFGVLISQPEIPLTMNMMFPKLSGDNVYSLMALLGANIMSHNFYIHSSLVQEQSRTTNISIGTLFHDHFFAILIIFTGIFLVNHVLMNSVAAVFSSADAFVLNFEDVSLLMDQIFRSPVAPITFFLALLLSSQIAALTWNIGGQVVLRSFFGINLSGWVHHVIFKTCSTLAALYCVKSAGTEGMYQLLIFCQVVLAILLPSSVIPLFRVASSRFIMGSFKIPWYVEILALLAFFGMLAANTMFSVEMLFGNSSWVMNLRGGMGSSVMVPYAFLLLIAWTSLGLTLYLAVTPLKSASDRPDMQAWTWNSLPDQRSFFVGRGDDVQDLIKYDEDQEPSVEPAIDMQYDKSILELNLDSSEAASECDGGSQQSVCAIPETFPTFEPQNPKSVTEVDLPENVETASAGTLSENDIIQTVEGDVQRVESKDLDEKENDIIQMVEGDVQRVESKGLDEKDTGIGVTVPTFKDSEGDTLEPEESPRGVSPLPATTSKCPESSISVVDKGFDGGNGSGSLSKLSGLGRAARRQLTAILDEFWGNLFDFHGKLTQEANIKRLDILLGLDLKAVGSSAKSGNAGAESTKSFYPDTERGSVFPANSRDYNPLNQKKVSSVDLSLGVQRGSPSWSQGMPSNTYLQSSSSSLLDQAERAYSSLRMPLHSESHDYQPATIHGYQIASYLKGAGATRNPYSSMSQNLSPEPKSVGSFLPNLRDQIMYNHGQNELSSPGTSGWPSQDMSRINRLQVERPYYDQSLLETNENPGSSSYTKKYHSSPDISALIASSRNAFLNEGGWGGPIGPRHSLGRMSYEQSQYLNNVSRLNSVSRSGVPLAFDKLSPPQLHKDVFSQPPILNMDTKSLWSTQPFEQFYGMPTMDQNEGVGGVSLGPSIPPKETLYAESEAKLLKSLRFCIMKMLKMEGSDWLFRQNGGLDEELIDRVALAERHLHEVDSGERNQVYTCEPQHLSTAQKFNSVQSNADADTLSLLSLRNCGDNCIWRASLVVSFGVWCIHRTLELALVESRPELWGKYTYVLNRLQGVIEPAFLKPRDFREPCSCLEIPSPHNSVLLATEKTSKTITSAGMVLEIIKDVEAAVSGRKGRTGTAAGDVAFPKGKENLASVLKRYKRRLLNKPQGTQESTPSRRPRTPASTLL